jgi:hypothetical protein
MQKAHERFGRLEFTKRAKDTTTRVRVHIDRPVLKSPKNERGRAGAHLISVIDGDSEIGVLLAAITEGGVFQIQLPGRAAFVASLGLDAQYFRGSVMVPGRKRPAKHSVALSAELAKTKPGEDREGSRTILCDDDPFNPLPRDMAFQLCRSGLRRLFASSINES